MRERVDADQSNQALIAMVSMVRGAPTLKWSQNPMVTVLKRFSRIKCSNTTPSLSSAITSSLRGPGSAAFARLAAMANSEHYILYKGPSHLVA
jgi:hypothetical protein